MVTSILKSAMKKSTKLTPRQFDERRGKELRAKAAAAAKAKAEAAAKAKNNPPVNAATSKMFARQFSVPTPGVKSADGSNAKAMRQVEEGASGKVNAGKDRPAFLPTPTQLDKKIVELENADRAGKLSAKDKTDLKALIKYRNKMDAGAANRQAGRTLKSRQTQSDAQRAAAAKRREAAKGDGFNQNTGVITDKKIWDGLTENRRRDLINSALIRRAITQKRAAELFALQKRPDKGPKIKSSKLPSRHSRGGSVGQANSRFSKRDYRKGGMILSTKKTK